MLHFRGAMAACRGPLNVANYWKKESRMANVFVEARPKGRQEGSPIEGYVVEDHADDELGECRTALKSQNSAFRLHFLHLNPGI